MVFFSQPHYSFIRVSKFSYSFYIFRGIKNANLIAQSLLNERQDDFIGLLGFLSSGFVNAHQFSIVAEHSLRHQLKVIIFGTLLSRNAKFKLLRLCFQSLLNSFLKLNKCIFVFKAEYFYSIAFFIEEFKFFLSIQNINSYPKILFNCRMKIPTSFSSLPAWGRHSSDTCRPSSFP